MTIPIETGIPIPKTAARAKPKYPWVDLQIGDSFFVELGTFANLHYLQRSVSSSGQLWSKRNSSGTVRFLTRQVDGGVRCWRIA